MTAKQVVEALRSRGLMLATAESCTGGMVAAAITDNAGSSDIFDRGFVTYSNKAKSEMLGVPAALIAERGAVSEAVARAMAEGALSNSHASIAIATTGIAGPGGGGDAKPVGLVHFSCARKDGRTQHAYEIFADADRAKVRRLATARALQMIMDMI